MLGDSTLIQNQKEAKDSGKGKIKSGGNIYCGC
jgi:hypothetical protein